MARLQEVLVKRNDEEDFFSTTVSVDELWNEIDEDDDRIFFYFANEQEYQEAKRINNGYEFRIIGEIN